MPVRSLNSFVLRWPDAATVRAAGRAWAVGNARRPEVLRIGIFGSYARGNPGVGSDLDLVAVVRNSDLPFPRRAALWDTTELPVPAELLIYTEAEWERLQATGGRFARMLAETVDWLVA